MDKKIKFLLLGFLVALAVNSNAQEHLDSLNKQSKHMLSAFSKQDYNTLLRYTHPKVLELMGGEEKGLTILNNAMEQLKSLNMIIKKAEIGSVVQILKTTDNIQCILPQMLEIEIGQVKAKSKNYLFGISYDGGRKWYFLDTSDRKEADLRSLIPEISKDLIIPKSETSYN